MDKERFYLACRTVAQLQRSRQGIGTLGEKSVHATLKYYLDPDETHHEISVGRLVADVCNEQGFFEIQTRGFWRLKNKLEAFLQIDSVTVVYPVSAKKWILWIDENGCAESRRSSSRTPTAASVLPELYSLKSLLSHPKLRICILLLEEEEYRLKDGYGAYKKKRATKFDRFPVDLLGEIWLQAPQDYLQLIPHSLPVEFTAKEYAKAAHLPAAKASAALNVLFEMGAVERVRQEKKTYFYQRSEKAQLS